MMSSRRLLAAFVLGVGLAACGAGPANAQSSQVPEPGVVHADFSPSSADFPNPERGFYRAASTDLDALSATELAHAYDGGYRLIYARINLERYSDASLPADYLHRLEAGFATAWRGGVKLILRATYNYPRGETEYRDARDASLSRVLQHLAQLRPVLRRNAHVISVMQAGFIGAWGEWHTSSNRLTEPGSRTRIKNALLEALPSTVSYSSAIRPIFRPGCRSCRD